MNRLALLSALLLAGCGSVADITGLVAGGASGVASGNPAIGYAVGVGTRVAAGYAVKYYGRVRQRAEQNAIAAVAGPLPDGAAADWRISHTIPLGNEGGRVELVRDIPNALTPCREIAFSIHDDPPAPEAWFVTTICRDGARWKWAAAEPAVERWGFLQ